MLCNDCITCQLNKPYPNQKQLAEKQDFKGQILYFNHRVSAINPVSHCNAYYAFTTLYKHWIAKFGLLEMLVTDNGTEFINNEIVTLCHLYSIKHIPRTSHAP